MPFSNRCFLIIASSCILLISSCKKDDDQNASVAVDSFSATVPEQWFSLHLKLVKETPGFTPPVAARSFAYAGLSLYESLVKGMPERKSFANLVNGYGGKHLPVFEYDNSYNWELVANAALATYYRNLFKTTSQINKTAIDDLESSIQTKDQSIASDVFDRSIDYGKKVGDVIYQFSTTDGQDAAYANNFPAYTLPVFEGAWVPTSPSNPTPLQPYWGNVRPFLTQNISNNIFPDHLPFSKEKSTAFYKEAFEVYTTSKNLTEEQKTIAKFWSDDPGLTATPSGHSISIALQILKNENANLAVAAEVFAKVGIAVHDAFVSCWRCKYKYNLLRPITYIKQHIDNNYSTLLNTPPFPEHTSGHSVQTAAAMTVLEHYFGENYMFEDHTHASRTDINGSPRLFLSFDALAQEAAISRLYGGIHFRTAIDLGIQQGQKIGSHIVGIKLTN